VTARLWRVLGEGENPTVKQVHNKMETFGGGRGESKRKGHKESSNLNLLRSQIKRSEDQYKSRSGRGEHRARVGFRARKNGQRQRRRLDFRRGGEERGSMPLTPLQRGGEENVDERRRTVKGTREKSGTKVGGRIIELNIERGHEKKGKSDSHMVQERKGGSQ